MHACKHSGRAHRVAWASGPCRGPVARSIRYLPVAVLTVVITGALIGGAAGCTHSPPAASQPNEAGAPPVEVSAADGDIRYTVTAARSSARVADQIEVTQSLIAPAAAEVSWPPLQPELGDFQTDHVRERPPAPEGASRRWERSFTIEAAAAGAHELPALEVEYHRAPPGAAGGEARRLAAGPLTIIIDSWIQGPPDPSKPRDVRGPLELSRDPLGWQWWLAVAAISVAAALLMFCWLRRRRLRAAIVPVIPPHEWALDALRSLAAERLPESGQIHEYYHRISSVVRGYIEKRFGLMAPERTTAEFLVEAQRSAKLRSEHQGLLSEFLTAADMVKFARHEPSIAEADAAMSAARGFVEQTIPAPSAESPDGSAAPDARVTGRAA